MEQSSHLWQSSTSALTLPPGTVHIWQAALDQPFATVARLERLLSDDERARAARFRFEHDRRRFIVARGILRSLLARYTNHLATQIEFSYSTKGKPALRPEYKSHIHFNLAHSGEMALYAFTLEHEVGVDIEQQRALDDVHQIAEHYFSSRERAILATLVGDELYRTFFTYWTRKEAYLKGSGEGLALLTTQLDVVAPQGLVVRLAGDNGEADWYIYDLMVATGYRGALALQERNVNIIYCQQ
jgi:4'-phosphopantetheinyl transferase